MERSIHQHIRLHPRPKTCYVSRGQTVFATGRDGVLRPGGKGEAHGLFVRETRLLSCYRYLINGEPWQSVDCSTIEQHTWAGYYVASTKNLGPQTTHLDADRFGLELQLRREVGEGMQEHVTVHNNTQHTCNFTLSLEIDVDFADVEEAAGERRQRGTITKTWEEAQTKLCFMYSVSAPYDHQGCQGVATFCAANHIFVTQCDSAPSWGDGCLSFLLNLKPRQTWQATLVHVPTFGEQALRTPDLAQRASRLAAWERRRHEAEAGFTYLKDPEGEDKSRLVTSAYNQAVADLISLRLYELDSGPRAWTVAAGLPGYVAVFGRDTLWTAIQAAPTNQALLEGALALLAKSQGQTSVDWYAEDPGKILHEAHRGPLAELRINNHLRSYCSITSSKFYCMVLGELWRWTGDKARIAPYVEPAMRAIHWLLHEAPRTSGGFWSYQRRSEGGLKNQGWKDSNDAIVDAKGSLVPDPIATCEEQGFAYQALQQMALVLWGLGRGDEAEALRRESTLLRERFHAAFWLEDLQFYAMALGPRDEPVRTVSSNPGHLLATGIVPLSSGRKVAERLMQKDMFSGWGVRTLSSDHPAYNPFSYHLGSVWPVEKGAFSRGFFVYGAAEALEKQCRAQFEAMSLFDFRRLPEVFSGHSRDEGHAFPALYPNANWPQAWSSSAVIAHINALLGIDAYAPLGLLLVDPQLPPWLPELTMRDLRIGQAQVTLHFKRQSDGTSSYEVTKLNGSLSVKKRSLALDLMTKSPGDVEDLLRHL